MSIKQHQRAESTRTEEDAHAITSPMQDCRVCGFDHGGLLQ